MARDSQRSLKRRHWYHTEEERQERGPRREEPKQRPGIEDEDALRTSAKRRHAPDSEDDRHEPQQKRRVKNWGFTFKHGNRSRALPNLPHALDHLETQRKSQAKRYVPKQVIVIDDDATFRTSRRGVGTREDPIRYVEWLTGNIISANSKGEVIAIDEEEEQQDAHDYYRRIVHRRLSSSSETEASECSSSIYGPSDQEELSLGQEKETGFEYEDRRSRISEDDEEHDHYLSQSSDSDEDSEDATQTPWNSNLPAEDKAKRRNYYQVRHSSKQSEEDSRALSSSQGSSDSGSPVTPRSNHVRYGDQTRGVSFKSRTTSQISNGGYDTDPENFRLQRLSERERIHDQCMDPIRHKKTLFYECYAPRMLPELERRLLRYRPESTPHGKCWLYDGPTREGQTKLEMHVLFRHKGVKYRYCVNAGFVALLVEGLLTEKFKKGIINERWHASHLCGNWKCTNPAHLTAEPGPVNIGRNSCLHGIDSVCRHSPACMPHFRVNVPRRTRKNLATQQQETDIREGAWQF